MTNPGNAFWNGRPVRVLRELEGGDLLVQFTDPRGELRAKIVRSSDVRFESKK